MPARPASQSASAAPTGSAAPPGRSSTAPSVGGSSGEALSPAGPVESPLLYRMPTSTRLLLWSTTRLPGPIMLICSVVLLIVLRHWYWWLLTVITAALNIPLWIQARKMMANLVLQAELEGGNILFRRWDGRVISVPRRGRALRRSSAEHPTQTILQVADSKDTLALIKQDKEATAMLADLDKRGVLRGPGTPKERPLTQQTLLRR